MPNPPLSRPWLVEQHIDMDGLRGRWLIHKRHPERSWAEEELGALRATASALETFRVRDARLLVEEQPSLFGGGI